MPVFIYSLFNLKTADERSFFPAMGFIELFVGRLFSVMEFDKKIHRKGRKERKEKQHDSLLPLLHSMKKHRLSELRTRMTRIRQIYTDTANPCASVSSVRSVFYGDCPHVAPNTKISGFIGVPPLFLDNRAKEECGVVANKEPQINADERRCILTTDYIKTTHRKGRKERKVKQQEFLGSGMENRYSINNELVRTDTNSSYQEFVRVRISSLLMSILSFSLRSLRSLRLDVFFTPERAIRALHGVSAFIGVHLRFLDWVIFQTGLTGYAFNPVYTVITRLKSQIPAARQSAMLRKGIVC